MRVVKKRGVWIFDTTPLEYIIIGAEPNAIAVSNYKKANLGEQWELGVFRVGVSRPFRGPVSMAVSYFFGILNQVLNLEIGWSHDWDEKVAFHGMSAECKTSAFPSPSSSESEDVQYPQTLLHHPSARHIYTSLYTLSHAYRWSLNIIR
jgi:hypothetical protein